MPKYASYEPPLPPVATVNLVDEVQPVVLGGGATTNGASTSDAMAGVYSAAETAAIRRFLLEAGVQNANDDVTTIAEIRGFIRGLLLL